jgi:hypothetical protein
VLEEILRNRCVLCATKGKMESYSVMQGNQKLEIGDCRQDLQLLIQSGSRRIVTNKNNSKLQKSKYKEKWRKPVKKCKKKKQFINQGAANMTAIGKILNVKRMLR